MGCQGTPVPGTVLMCRSSVLSGAAEPAAKTTLYKTFGDVARCCRPRFPPVRTAPRCGDQGCQGAGAASRSKRQPMSAFFDFDYLAQQLINGLVLGTVYGLIAI